MATQQSHNLLGHLRQLIGRRTAAGVTDADLLERFRAGRDEAAFELLVRRHAPLVFGVCRRLLHSQHDAEDAFQATFLTLVRKADSIGNCNSLGSWLYKVAFRSALRVRDRALRRTAREQPLGDEVLCEDGADPADEAAWRELRPVLDAEIQRLPEKYREVVVLCCLQGKTNEEAAAALGCPKGTVLSRLSRARERLRDRLSCRGLFAAAEAVTGELAAKAAPLAAVSPVLINAAVQAGLLLALKDLVAGQEAAPADGPVAVAARSPTRRRLAYAAAVVAGLLLAGTGYGVFAYGLRPSDDAPAGSPAGAGGTATGPNPFGFNKPHSECPAPAFTALPPPKALLDLPSK